MVGCEKGALGPSSYGYRTAGWGVWEASSSGTWGRSGCGHAYTSFSPVKSIFWNFWVRKGNHSVCDLTSEGEVSQPFPCLFQFCCRSSWKDWRSCASCRWVDSALHLHCLRPQPHPCWGSLTLSPFHLVPIPALHSEKAPPSTLGSQPCLLRARRLSPPFAAEPGFLACGFLASLPMWGSPRSM